MTVVNPVNPVHLSGKSAVNPVNPKKDSGKSDKIRVNPTCLFSLTEVNGGKSELTILADAGKSEIFRTFDNPGMVKHLIYAVQIQMIWYQ